MWSHLSGVNHKPRRNHHQTNQILKPTCLAYVSVRGSTGDRWHAEISIIGKGFNKRVIYKSVGRIKETIEDSAELEPSKNCSIFTSRPDKIKGRIDFKESVAEKESSSQELQSSVQGLSLPKPALQGRTVRINPLKLLSFSPVSR